MHQLFTNGHKVSAHPFPKGGQNTRKPPEKHSKSGEAGEIRPEADAQPFTGHAGDDIIIHA